ncbi:MAG: hypothetical protein KA109_01275 [Saprospiraceae bacterium]|jgi:hypothetical protein|nr:hypothetical protein [Saprospiraceae bacterium]MBK6478662.1 hypothetical protein [Saprospiraceae bacterium]MBK6814155.1 hypothetical protein [Saprospiraceae bacterium]MBK7373598.1 hypothetical protein [Saprospiraceae bacterium]MBK7437269.1 hypothetical protein [Saprospiraceae bacterium]
MKKTFFSGLFTFLSLLVFAQYKVNSIYTLYGISFKVPKGWLVTEHADSYLLTNSKDPGYIIIETHTHRSLDEVKIDLLKGLYDGEGTSMTSTGRVIKFHPNGYASSLSGLMTFQAAKIFMLSLFNPQGMGINIISGSSPKLYDSHYKELALEIASSTEFENSKLANLLVSWEKVLSNSRLTHFISGDASNPLATREVIDLCYSDHQFSYIHPDLPSGLTGNWKISHDDAGVPILFLAAVDGTQKEFALSLKEGKTFLNDTRFIRSFNNELTPYCLR